MPVNLDALLRYHTINHCLQQRGKRWTWNELADACADYAGEVAPRDSRAIPSRRTILGDIKLMRSGDLGYFAPIKSCDGGYYYDQAHYSIKNASLTNQDLNAISTAAKVLGQYKGFDFFKDLTGVFDKLESNIIARFHQNYNEIIAFEKNDTTIGTEFLKPLLEAISQKIVIEIAYRKFSDCQEKLHRVHPYLLKEYDGRWYLLGWSVEKNLIATYALDRMKSINELSEIIYIEKNFNAEAYFEHTLGISFVERGAEEIELWVESTYAPYLLSKPLHKSQTLIESNNNYIGFKYRLVINQELENWILAHANHLKNIKPDGLRQAILEKIKKAEINFS